jgi:hypothetical protein
MSPTILYVHNFHIQVLIEEFSPKKNDLWKDLSNVTSHAQIGFFFEFKWSRVKFQVWFLIILLAINFYIIILNNIYEPNFHIYVSKPFQWYIGGPFRTMFVMYIFVLKIQNPRCNYNSQSASHLNVFESQNNFHLLPFSCLNFDCEPKIRVATTKTS